MTLGITLVILYGRFKHHLDMDGISQYHAIYDYKSKTITSNVSGHPNLKWKKILSIYLRMVFWFF